MSRDRILALIDAAAATIAANADELTRLDQAIGDGDHGSNMARGFQAIAAQREALAALEPGEALQKAGMILVTTVGGASGPLYGSLLMGIGKGLKAGKDAGRGFRRGGREREEAGQVGRRRQDHARRAGADAGGRCATARRPAELREVATASREATKPMQATRGRASFLGERSIGHYDPGATSSCLLIHAVCDVLEPAA